MIEENAKHKGEWQLKKNKKKHTNELGNWDWEKEVQRKNIIYITAYLRGYNRITLRRAQTLNFVEFPKTYYESVSVVQPWNHTVTQRDRETVLDPTITALSHAQQLVSAQCNTFALNKVDKIMKNLPVFVSVWVVRDCTIIQNPITFVNHLYVPFPSRVRRRVPFYPTPKSIRQIFPRHLIFFFIFFFFFGVKKKNNFDVAAA